MCISVRETKVNDKTQNVPIPNTNQMASHTINQWLKWNKSETGLPDSILKQDPNTQTIKKKVILMRQHEY